MDRSKIRIGTRKSALAQTQTRWVAEQLAAAGIATETVFVESRGDVDRSQPLYTAVGNEPGLFTKLLEDALLARTIDVAVHSLKDLPTQSPEGLLVAAVPLRETVEDWLLVRQDRFDAQRPLGLPAGARIGTSSLRREALLLEAIPDAEIVPLRGNVPTRVEKARSGDLDAVVLASAGLRRLALDLSGVQRVALPPETFLPAPAQGALGIQTRADLAAPWQKALTSLNHAASAQAVRIERAILRAVEGGCTVPLGIWCTQEPGSPEVYVRAFLGLLEGDKAVLPHHWHSFHRTEAQGLEAVVVANVAEKLRALWDAFQKDRS